MSNPLNRLNRLGLVIDEHRRQAGVSENTAALNSGISRQTLRRRLKGADVYASELGALAYVLNVPAECLVGITERGDDHTDSCEQCKARIKGGAA